MKRFFTFWSVVILLGCGILAMADERETMPQIENIRLGLDGQGQTRLVFELDTAPTYVVAPQGAQQPILTVFIQGASSPLRANDMPKARGLVRDIQIKGARIEVQLAEYALPVKSFVIPPNKDNKFFRLVVDLKATNTAQYAQAVLMAPELPVIEVITPVKIAEVTPPIVEPEVASDPISVVEALAVPEKRLTRKERRAAAALEKAQRQAALKAQEDAEKVQAAAQDAENAADLTLPPELLAMAERRIVPPAPSVKPKRAKARQINPSGAPITIVLDAGHGGYDPGAVGRTGLKEKTVTLAAAQVLAAKLRTRGYNVILTRDGDRFIDLEERMHFAREQRADLFLSLHADANPDPLARGATVYTLTEKRAQEVTDTAEETGDFSVFDVVMDDNSEDVERILFSLANSETKNQSAKLATALVSEMRGRVPMVTNTHRKASLQVLLSPDVPAVLVELAFLSNKKDEANLASGGWRDRATIAIADGIDLYFETKVAGYSSQYIVTASGGSY